MTKMEIEERIFTELQVQLKYFDSHLDPLHPEKYPKQKIIGAIKSLLDIISKNFQLKSTYYTPIVNFSKSQIADVDFYLIGQNLEYCVASIIRTYNLSEFAYGNHHKKNGCKGDYKTLNDHLQILVELEKEHILSHTTETNLYNHLIGYRNAISHVSQNPQNVDVRREYIKATIGAIVLIIYYINLHISKTGCTNNNSNHCRSTNTYNKNNNTNTTKNTNSNSKNSIDNIIDSLI